MAREVDWKEFLSANGFKLDQHPSGSIQPRPPPQTPSKAPFVSTMASHPRIARGDHKSYMLHALAQARLSPPSPSKFCVGAVLVDADQGEILSTGYSEELPRDRPGDPGSTHAEHCCFIKVGDRHGVHDSEIAPFLPANTVLYTTMEPCNERLSGNRTCVDRIVGLGNAIKVVYVGIREPDTFIQLNEGIKRLEGAGVKVVLMDEDPELRALILKATFAGHDNRD